MGDFYETLGFLTFCLTLMGRAQLIICYQQLGCFIMYSIVMLNLQLNFPTTLYCQCV